MMTFQLALVASLLGSAAAAPFPAFSNTTMTLSKRVNPGKIAGQQFEDVMDYTTGASEHEVLGVRQQKEYGVTELCRFLDVNVYIDEKDPQQRPTGEQVKIQCAKTRKAITWDIKRVGKTYDCGTMNDVDHFALAKSTTEAFNTKVGASANFGGFGASTEFEYHKEMTVSTLKETTTQCADGYTGKTCLVGAPALIELVVREGWVVVPCDKPKTRKGIINHFKKLYDTPSGDMQWRDKDNADKNYGMTDVTEKNFYSYNPDYNGGFDYWRAYGDDCEMAYNQSWGVESVQ